MERVQLTQWHDGPEVFWQNVAKSSVVTQPNLLNATNCSELPRNWACNTRSSQIEIGQSVETANSVGQLALAKFFVVEIDITDAIRTLEKAARYTGPCIDKASVYRADGQHIVAIDAVFCWAAPIFEIRLAETGKGSPKLTQDGCVRVHGVACGHGSGGNEGRLGRRAAGGS